MLVEVYGDTAPTDKSCREWFFLVSFNLEKYGHILQWTDEGYLIFNVCLQRYYLKRYFASFSETFYGLKRVTIINSKTGLQKKLSHKQQILSLIIIVTFPYLKNKLVQLSSKYKLQNIDSTSRKAREVPNIAQQYKGICPLCYKPHHIHTVLMVSGYIFCYQCILSEIRIKKKCPVTYYPAKEDDLIRLYIE
ncbi:PEX12 protein, partial [Acromyrmex insinuator]